MKLKNKCSLLLAGVMLAGALVGCGASSAPASSAASSEAAASSAVSEAASASAEAALPDGTYTADFDTDSSMFHANEAFDGKGALTVKDGQMTLHVSLVSKNIVNLYVGTAEDAASHEADWLQPTTDVVNYSDGTSDEVYGFDIPVEALDTDFSVAIFGKKGKWYDHKVSVTNAVLKEDDAAAPAETLADGTYTIAVTLEGGSGKANIQSPCTLTVADGKMTAQIVWSSSHYDYMLVDGERYDAISNEDGSTFEIPVSALDTPLAVVGDTTAMSTPLFKSIILECFFSSSLPLKSTSACVYFKACPVFK